MENLLDIKRKECYQLNSINFKPNEKSCELIFDGLMCWNATKPGILAKQPCPPYLALNPKEFATKYCTESGEWFVDPQLKKKWTNYSQCEIPLDESTGLVGIDIDLENSALYHTWFPVIKTISQWGYGISLVTLITALMIFLSIKKLQCARNRLHMHLFFSFIMRGLMSLVKDTTFVEGVAMQSDVVFIDGHPRYIKEHYNWICKAIITARNYFILANYMLILMEGIYLHNLMFLTLLSDNSRIIIYYLLGWGLPVLFITPWIFVRFFFEDNLCWTTWDNKYYFLLIEIPIGLAITISFVLFLTIVRVLFVKLTSMYIQHRKKKYRRLMRSTLILVPLFGVPYAISLVVSTATTNSLVELLWIFWDQTFTSFQGFFVAVIYCLANSEVHIEIKRKYNSVRNRHSNLRRSRERTISHTQQFPTTILPLNDEFNGNAYSMSILTEKVLNENGKNSRNSLM